jgi:hypothetical protein
VVLRFEVEIVTRQLSLSVIPEGRQERHQIIESLYSSGLNDKYIASELNQRGIKTPSGKDYYYELVFVTRRKMRLRKEGHSMKVTVMDIRLDSC